MIKKLTEYLNYDLFAELALVTFAAVFVAIVIRTLMMHREESQTQSQIVLKDGEEQAK